MGEVIPIDRNKRRRLAELDRQIEPLAREAEEIRRELGLIAIERGTNDDN